MKFLARHDTLIAIIGTGILTAGYYWGVVCPGRVAALKIEAEITQVQTKMAELPLILAERAQLQSRLQRYRDQIDAMDGVLPTESHVSDVLHEVASLASRAGLTITRLEPLQTVEFASYATHPFHLGCRGAFDDVARFLNGLETQSRLVTFGKVDLTRGADGQTSDGPQRSIQANIDFSVYSRHANSTRVAENTSSRGSSPSDN